LAIGSSHQPDKGRDAAYYTRRNLFKNVTNNSKVEEMAAFLNSVENVSKNVILSNRTF